jgi:hypothetical protein
LLATPAKGTIYKATLIFGKFGEDVSDVTGYGVSYLSANHTGASRVKSLMVGTNTADVASFSRLALRQSFKHFARGTPSGIWAFFVPSGGDALRLPEGVPAFIGESGAFLTASPKFRIYSTVSDIANSGQNMRWRKRGMVAWHSPKIAEMSAKSSLIENNT